MKNGLLVAALAANGTLTGASLDQSIKQLPSRKKIGATRYSEYSRAADLGNGIPFYAILGVGAACVSIFAAVKRHDGRAAVSAGVLSVAHLLATIQAAPINFAQRRYKDEASLERVLDRFAFWHSIRASLQAATLIASACALIEANRRDGSEERQNKDSEFVESASVR